MAVSVSSSEFAEQIGLPTSRDFCAIPADWAAEFSQCLYDWQGLEAGVLALLAALIGARYLQRQIRQAEQHREDELQRKRLAAIVALPLTLAQTSEMLQGIADEIAARFELNRSGNRRDEDFIIIGPGVTKFEVVDLSDRLIRSYQDFVESLSDRNDVAHVAQLIASLQILLARLNSFDPRTANGENALVSLMLDCAWAAHLNDRLYDHARSLGTKPFSLPDRVPARDWANVRSTSHSLLFFRANPDPMMIALNEMIDRYVESGASPWIDAKEDV
jgi:hypothetical protein